MTRARLWATIHIASSPWCASSSPITDEDLRGFISPVLQYGMSGFRHNFAAPKGRTLGTGLVKTNMPSNTSWEAPDWATATARDEIIGCSGKLCDLPLVDNALVIGGEEIALVATTNLFSNSSWVCPSARKSPRRPTVVAEKGARRGYQDGAPSTAPSN